MAIPVVVVGLGVRGRQWIGELRRSRAFHVIAGCDPAPEARARAAHEALAVFPSLADALTAVSPRAAIIATPVGHHVSPCLQAIGAGLAVLVEKPLALTVVDAQRVVAAAKARGTPLLVGQNHRYLRMFRASKAVLEQGILGRLAMVTISSYREGHPPVAGLPEIRAAALWETGIHHLDALRYLLGDEVVGISAATATPPWSDGLRGTTWSVILEYQGGPLVSYQLSWDSRGHRAFEGGQQFIARFVGERGTLHVLQRWLLLCRAGHWPRLVRRGARNITEETQLLHQLERAIREHATPEVSGADNVRTVALAEACVRAADERRRIDPRDLLHEG